MSRCSSCRAAKRAAEGQEKARVSPAQSRPTVSTTMSGLLPAAEAVGQPDADRRIGGQEAWPRVTR